MTKLPKIQRDALEKMEPEKWYSAHELGIRAETLTTLYRKGFLKITKKRGYFGDVFLFKLTGKKEKITNQQEE